MVRWKPVAMSDHRRAAGYNFSQPACPEKKTAWAIPRPIPTLKSWFEGRGSSDHLVKLCYHLEYWNLARAAVSPSDSLVPTQKPVYTAMASASELLLPAVTTFYLKKTQDGMEGQANHTLMSRLRDRSCQHCFFPCTRWALSRESPRQDSTKPIRVGSHSGFIKCDLSSIY